MPHERQTGKGHHPRPSPLVDDERLPLLAPPETAAEPLTQTYNENGSPAADSSPEGTSPSTKITSGASTPVDDEHTEANQTLSLERVCLCTFALGCLILVQATNISMLTTTQSNIAEDLDAFEQTPWFTSSYLIAMSALSPLNGKLSSVFSPRACIVVSSVILALGATASGFAHSFAAFVVGRVITGIGASGVFTVSIIIVLELTGSRHRGLGIGALNSGYTFGVAIGATVAGALVDIIGWRALFWIQVPISLVGGVILLFAIPADFSSSKRKAVASADDEEQARAVRTWRLLAQLDYLGALTLTVSIVFLLYGLSSPTRILATPLGLSAVVLSIFLLNEIYFATDPIIPVALLRSRGLLLTCLATVGYMMARWSVLFYTPTYAIAVRQWPPAAAGSLIIPTNLGFAVGGLLVGWLHIRRQGSFYLSTLLVYAIFPITLLILALLATRDSSITLVVLVVFFCGFTTGAALNYNLAHLLHLIPKETHYVATALVATFRGFAGSFGSAIGGGLFTRTLSRSLTSNFKERGMLNGRESLVRRLLGSPALVGSLGGVERDVAIKGYEDGLRVLWLAGAALAIAMVFVQAGTGWEGQAGKTAHKAESGTVLPPSSTTPAEEGRA